MSIWRKFFGEKSTTIEQSRIDTIPTVELSSKDLDQFIAQGKAVQVEMIEMFMLDPTGNYTQLLEVGKDIDREFAHGVRDEETGIIYGVTVYIAGEPSRKFLTPSKWYQVKAAMDAGE